MNRHIKRLITYSVIAFFLHQSIESDISAAATTENDFEVVEKAHEANKNRKRRAGDEFGSPDPNVALKGECVVVCDAKVIASKQPLRNQDAYSDPGDDFDADVGMDDRDFDSTNSRSNILNKLPCGGLSGRNVRPVAFSVVRSSNTGKPSTMNRMTVTFDYMLVNVGNGFNSESSAFVPPVNGVYSISFNVYRLYNLNAVTIALKVSTLITSAINNSENNLLLAMYKIFSV